MKKILFLLMAVVSVLALQAQIQTRSSMTTTNADTLSISNVGSKVVSLQVTYTETSGTSAGKFYIQGTNDGIGWVHVDSSKSVSDTSAAQSVVVAVTATTYRDYRVIFTNTSSATGTLYFTVTRRPDDRVPLPSPIPAAKSKYLPQPFCRSGELWGMRSQDARKPLLN